MGRHCADPRSQHHLAVPNYRLDLAYLGTGFHGYARQPDVRTVQGDLEDALFPYTGPVESYVAGRTDRGVHAIGQVVSFSIVDDLECDRVMRSLNRRLAPEIAVQAMAVVPDDFHARFSATGRSYRYIVLTRTAPDPFLAATSWHYARPLDLTRMNAAAAHFIGEQDFASLCRRTGEAGTVRNVREAVWVDAGMGRIEYHAEASSFCHQMIRSMVSICVDAGRNKIDPHSVPEVLAALDRNASRGAAPPHGLTLVSVDYGSAQPGRPR